MLAPEEVVVWSKQPKDQMYGCTCIHACMCVWVGVCVHTRVSVLCVSVKMRKSSVLYSIIMRNGHVCKGTRTSDIDR